MAKKNAELIGETAEVLLDRIKEQAGRYEAPEQLKQLAEAFAIVASNDKQEPGRVTVM